MAVCNGLNSHALRPGSIYTGGTFDTLMGEVTKRHLGHCNMPLLCPGKKKHQALFVNEKRRNYELVLKQIESGEVLWLQLLLGTVTRLLAGATVLHRLWVCTDCRTPPPGLKSSWSPFLLEILIIFQAWTYYDPIDPKFLGSVHLYINSPFTWFLVPNMFP